jgi:hypothetical protein
VHAVVFYGAALVLLAVLVATRTGVLDRRPRVRPGPATDQLFDEPPAIVALLAGGFRPSPVAAPATLVDLAARGVLRADGTHWRRAADAELAAHESSAHALVPPSGEATWPELLTACAGAEFAREFQTAVVTDAASRGLLRPALRRAASGRAELATDRVQRPTPAGTDAASRWLGVRAAMAAEPGWRTRDAAAVGAHGRRLAYAMALRLTPIGVPASSEPRHAAADNDGAAVLPPRGAAATTPRDVLTRSLLLAGAAALLGSGLLTAGLLGWAGPAVAGLVVAFALAGAYRGLADILSPRTIEGPIVHKVLRDYDPYGPDRIGLTLGGTHREVPPQAWIAVDDGRTRPVRGVRLHPDIADGLAVGDVVRARIAPRTGWTYSITMITPGENR